METVKIPLAVDLNIEAFSGGAITRYDSGIINGLVRQDNDQWTVTQRPGIDIFFDSDNVGTLNNRARGIYYWEHNTSLYNVHDNDVYYDNYTSTTGDISTGTEKVTILEGTDSSGNDVLIILDPENDEGWLVSTGHVVTDIDGASNWNSLFPSTLSYGGAILDGYLFVMDEEGVIYNSTVDSVNTSSATFFLTAERAHDQGVYLGKHHDHIVAFGTQTIEFFYDTANPTGSPLTRRPDISYNIGCADGQSVWEHGDITYFIGSDSGGAIGVYKLEDFRVTKISKNSIDSYLTHNITQESIYAVGSGMMAQGHPIYTITLYILDPDITPITTIVYDASTQLWGIWKTAENGHITFPLIGWTKRTGGYNVDSAARAGEGVFSNGDLLTLKETITPTDTIGGLEGYIAEGYITAGYFSAVAEGNLTNIAMSVRTGLWDGGGSVNKIQNKIKPIMQETETNQTLTLKWTTSTETSNFTTGRTLDTSKRQFARQGGRFTKRNYDLSYSGDEQVYIESLEVDLTVGIR